MPRLRLLLLVVPAALLTACSAHTTVSVDESAKGSGTVGVQVVLDKEAAAAVPNLSKQLRTDDLKSSGWNVDPIKKNDDGGEVVKATHKFDNAAEGNAVLAQLGQSGPFQNFHLTQKHSLLNSATDFSGTVDLSKGIDSFGDSDLAKLSGAPLGFDSKELQTSLGIDLTKVMPVDVVVNLPGSTKSVTPAVDTGKVWHVAYGATTPLSTSAKGFNSRPVTYLGIGVFAALGTVGMLIFWRPEKYHPQHSAKAGGIRARDLLNMSSNTGGPQPA